MNHRRTGTIAVALALTLCAAPAPSQAQNFPSKPLRIIVGFPPGGGTDKFARMVAVKLTAGLGQSTVVDNRPGAGGIVGTELVAKSPPDGHTMLVTTSAYVISAALAEKLPYDPINGLAPVAMFAVSPSVVIVHPSLPVRSLKELISFTKANPDKVNYGSSGNGAPYHIATEMFKSMAGVNMVHVPYKGAGPAVTAAMGGEVAVLFANIVSAMPLAKAGRMRALAVTTAKRSPIAPDIPTIAESGVPGYDFATWFGALVAGGTPAAIVQRLNREFRQAVTAPDLRAALLADGAEPIDATPEAFAQVIRQDIQQFTKLAKQVGMTVD
jgi:tripartite-type tricarboxylate transporter receptor subunit TctC